MKFGSSATKATTTGGSGVDTLIGKQTEILGDIRFSGGLHVDGAVKGKVLTTGEKASSLSVSENGAIEGDVRVPHIVLNGTVVGDVHAAEKITIAAKARVTGNVYYKIIEMEAGAQINGQLVHESHAAASIGGIAGDSTEFDELEARRAKGFING
jgi:cytoskeletal protein CcmA (bactofilin family)